MIKTARLFEKINAGVIIDITVKNNKNHVLAPTWELVMGIKNGKITWGQYVEEYIKLLNDRIKTRRSEFDTILAMAQKQDVYLGCYCTDEMQCHRTIAKDYLNNIGR